MAYVPSEVSPSTAHTLHPINRHSQVLHGPASTTTSNTMIASVVYRRRLPLSSFIVIERHCDIELSTPTWISHLEASLFEYRTGQHSKKSPHSSPSGSDNMPEQRTFCKAVATTLATSAGAAVFTAMAVERTMTVAV